ncbi:hypothetical protein DOY81_007741 [Sarcophaga bullata]|nr:hypothetical protein DOY81_007741 [Sarcophaga bullata]
MKFLVLALIVCVALFAVVNAVPIDESIPQGIEGAASETVNPSDDQSILLKLKLLKKLLLLG